MSDPDTRPILARICAAHRGSSADAAAVGSALDSGFSRAIRRASMPYATLRPEVGDITLQEDAKLSDGTEALPDHGLLAAIEDSEGRRGLIALDHPLVDALIEVQATGSVEEAEQPPRQVTRIDEALCRDFVDLMLGAFAQETAEQAGRDWPDRMSYGSKIGERGQLNLLLPERGYRLMHCEVTMGGHKTGRVLVLLPCDPKIARHRALASPDAAADPVDWSAQMLKAVGAAPIVLDAVLMRVTMPLGEVKALGEGGLVPFDHSDLTTVSLENDQGHVFAKGSLGQMTGRRAVRLGDAATSAPAVGQPQGGLPGMGQTPQLGAGMPAPAASMPMAAEPSLAGLTPDAPMDGMAPSAPMGGFDPDAPMGGAGADLPMGGIDPDAPMGGFDPDAPGGFDPDAPMGGFDPDAPMTDFDPNAPMGGPEPAPAADGFDPNAPMM